MEKELIAKLNNLNQRFYETHADSFDQSRAIFWPGWGKLVENQIIKGQDLKVLDAGCGNGRFFEFLLDQRDVSIEKYFGVDSSRKLLELARKKHKGSKIAAFQKLDLLNLADMSKLDDDFDIVVAFGLLHHIPCFYQRLALIELLASKLKLKGIIVLTLWQFMKSKRLASKRLSKSQIAQILGGSAQYMQEGDFLLDWDKSATPRYCHDFSDGEVQKVITNLENKGLKLAHKFQADGKEGNLNTYLAFRKS